MDSGNSGGSFQSSSGDEEHDSRAGPAEDSFSALSNKRQRALNHGGFQFQANNNPLISNPANFDLLSNYFDAISRPPPPPLLNLDMSWSKTLRSDHMIPSSNAQPFFSTATAAEASSMNPPGTENNRPAAAASSEQSRRNPKKRSRASRRAPTTVLTTDTTNFRAMVQEFTGIPAPPFPSSSSASPFSRLNTQRLDLYGTVTPPSLRSNPLDSSQAPSYLTRPFPQKPPPPQSLPFLASSMVDLDHHTNFQLPSATATNPFNNHLILSSAMIQSSSKESPLKVGGMILDQFGHVNTSSLGSGLPGLISSDQATSSNNTPANWDMWARMNAATNGKTNNFSSSTNPYSFHGDNGKSDNVAAAAGGSRGEGMVESWICSSD